MNVFPRVLSFDWLDVRIKAGGSPTKTPDQRRKHDSIGCAWP